MKVVTTDASKNYSIKIKEFGAVVEPGIEFEVTEDRFNALNGNNYYNLVFVTKPKVSIMGNRKPKVKEEPEVKEEPKVEEPIIEETKEETKEEPEALKVEETKEEPEVLETEEKPKRKRKKKEE